MAEEDAGIMLVERICYLDFINYFDLMGYFMLQNSAVKCVIVKLYIIRVNEICDLEFNHFFLKLGYSYYNVFFLERDVFSGVFN